MFTASIQGWPQRPRRCHPGNSHSLSHTRTPPFHLSTVAQMRIEVDATSALVKCSLVLKSLLAKGSSKTLVWTDDSPAVASPTTGACLAAP